MKYLLLALLLTACTSDTPGHKFKKGDCAQYAPNKCERWQNHCKINTIKILEVGQEHYHAIMYYSDVPHSYFVETADFSTIDTLYNKTECWLNFGDSEGDTVYPEKE